MTRDVVTDFKRVNQDFNLFFGDKSNKQDFIDKIRALSDEGRLEIRDYYLTLLHQLGKVGFFNNSIYLSTSTDIREANRFSAKEKRPHSIIFVSWVCKSASFALMPGFYKKGDKISSIGLPTYSRPFYPRQKEISLKGGLLPHYILGYIKVDTWEMELNPNLFTTEKSFRKILADGFDIDQSGFQKKLTETDYEYFFNVDDNGNHWDERMPM